MVIYNFEYQDIQKNSNPEPFITRNQESKKVRYLDRYNMIVDHYSNESGILSNFLSNALKIKVTGGSPKEVINGVSSGKYQFGIVKEEILQSAFFGKDIFETEHINLRPVSRLFPVSMFFMSNSKSPNYIKSITNIKQIAEKRHINIGIYSPKFLFANKIKEPLDTTDPTIMVYYKLFNFIGLKMKDSGKNTYSIKVYNKRNKLLVDFKNPATLDFCCIYDVFENNGLLENWSTKIPKNDIHIFGLDDIPNNDIRFLYPKKKIKTIDITFSPYNNDSGSNINENEILEQLIIELIDYFFDKQGYFFGKVIEKDQQLKIYTDNVSKQFLSNYDTIKGKWEAIKQKKSTSTTKQLKQQLQGMQNNIVNNNKVTRELRLKKLKEKELIMKLKILKSKCLVKYEKKADKSNYLPMIECKQARATSDMSLINLNKELEDTIKKYNGLQDDIEYKNKIIKSIKKSMENTDITTPEIKSQIAEMIKITNENNSNKKEITFNEAVLSLSDFNDNSKLPEYSPFTIYELNQMTISKFEGFYNDIIKKIDIDRKKTTNIKNKSKLKKQKEDFITKFKKYAEYEKTIWERGNLIRTNFKGITGQVQYSHPMANRTLSPISLKTIQEYYVLFTEEDVRIPPVYNVLYTFLKLPNKVKTRNSKLMLPSNYNIPLHNGVIALYNEYDTASNIDDICRNKIGDMDCIVKNLT